MSCIYKNVVNGCGDLACNFLSDGIFILFGDNAPDTLKDYCYTIDVVKAKSQIKSGQSMQIGDCSYQITAVGDVAQKNLEELGHLTVSFSGESSATLPGTVVVEKNDVPIISIGSIINIFE